MNELILKKYDGNVVEYYYKPEGRGQSGIVSFDAQTGKAEITVVAKSDCGEQYDRMAQIAVEQIARKNTLPKQYTQAWY